MTKTISYRTSGVCSREIRISVKDDVVESVEYIGGCNGNTKGVAALACGMKVDDVIERLSGIRCGFKATSCPDQLAKALASMKQDN